MAEQKSLKKNAAYSALRACMNVAFPLISFPYASRVLQPQGIGVVNFTNALIDFYMLICTLGIGGYASREASRIRDDKNALTQFCREIFVFNLISMSFAYLLFIISLLVSPKLYVYKSILSIVSAKLFFETIGIAWLFAATEDYKFIALRSVSFQIISLAFLFIFVRTEDDYLAYAFMGIISNIGCNISNFFYARKYVHLRQKTPIHLRRHVKKIFIFFGSTVAEKLYSITDSVMLGFLSNPASVGFYAAANKLVNLVINISSTVLGTSMPRTTYLFEKSKTNQYQTLVITVINLAITFSIPASIGLFLLCRQTLRLFSGKEFVAAATAMQLLCPQVFLCTIAAAITNVVLLPQKKEKYIFIAQATGCIINMLCNIILILKFDVIGATLATFIAQTVIGILIAFFGRQYITSPKIIHNLIKVCIGSIAMGYAVHITLTHITYHATAVALSIPVGLFVYGMVEILLGNASVISIANTMSRRLLRRPVF
ncbi:MAG: flippase [Treponema sp.]|nr:flippase [Treponema sp.]